MYCVRRCSHDGIYHMCEIFSTKLSNQRPYACRIAGSTCKLVGNVFSLFNKQNYYLLF